MVIGGHPHVVQPVEKKTIDNEEKLTTWSLGNYVSNMKIRYTRGGVMIGATVEKEADKTTLKDVEHHLVYVLKKQEGPIRPYYILPDFNYNKYRPGFISSAETVKMNQFFADSRKLFSQYNKGEILEARIDETSEVGHRYKQYLTEYFSVRVTQDGAKWMDSEILGHYFHKTVDRAGNVLYLSGFYADQKMAAGHLRFLSDCGIIEPQLVKVSPTLISTVE